jgi:flavin-dependent dehydrogenase
MTIKCDVLVVGGGPAGLTAALLSSKKGFSTIVLEKNKTGGPQHTLYDITEGTRIQKILDEMNVKPKKISSISEWFSPKYSYVLDSNIQDFYFKRGPESDSLENVLVEKVCNQGVDIFFESTIDTIELNKTDIVLVQITGNKTIQPRYVIAADGPESTIRKKLKVKTKQFVTFKGLGVIGESVDADIIPHAKIYFDEKIAPGGYVYSGSVNRDFFFCIVIDDICSKKILSRKKLECFVESRGIGKFTVKNFFRGVGSSGIQKTRVGNTLFVGGAALLYDPFLGYGLNYAIESANAAVNAIEKINTFEYEEYTDTIKNEMRRNYIARKIWRKADNIFFDQIIKAFNGNYDTNDREINKIMEVFSE